MTSEFIATNNLKLICRAHQLVHEVGQFNTDHGQNLEEMAKQLPVLYWATNVPRLKYTLFFSQGYKYMFDDSLVTVWSAPNYCYRSASFLYRVSSDSVDFQMWQHRFNSAVFRRGQPHTETL